MVSSSGTAMLRDGDASGMAVLKGRGRSLGVAGDTRTLSVRNLTVKALTIMPDLRKVLPA